MAESPLGATPPTHGAAGKASSDSNEGKPGGGASAASSTGFQNELSLPPQLSLTPSWAPRLHGVLLSSTFRLALIYMVLFSLSVIALLAFIYWSTAGYMARQTDATIEAEISGLAERYRLTGLEGLVRSINSRIRRSPFGSNIYLLTDREKRRIVGNLDRWPAHEPDENGWMEFKLEQTAGPGETHRGRARQFRLHGEFHLLVGRDMFERLETEKLIVRALASGLAITVLLAFAGGIMMSRSTVRRIEAINATSREIMSGELSQRIPTRGTSDDFDLLANNLNSMLDQIERLMIGVRQVSDNIAHDLRTPLTRLRTRLETLRDEPGDRDEIIEQAIVEADGLLATFNALLRIARIEAGARRSGFKAVDLQEVLADVLELYEPLAHERGQRLLATLDDSVAMRGDRDLLFQAFANLLDNAIKYTPEGGDIEVILTARPTGSLVRISDSGPGIPAAERQRVFERFVRLEASRNEPGNGLGLSLVAAVAKLHGARIQLEDAEPGLSVVLEFSEPAGGAGPRSAGAKRMT